MSITFTVIGHARKMAQNYRGKLPRESGEGEGRHLGKLSNINEQSFTCSRAIDLPQKIEKIPEVLRYFFSCSELHSAQDNQRGEVRTSPTLIGKAHVQIRLQNCNY